MNALRSLVGELAGLFVEDRWFALALALWLLVFAGASHAGVATPLERGYALFGGLAVVLVAGVARGARPPR
ncbi:MAG: hypothetical protein M3R53_03405 [Candidatus Eremiobacteraeota bacterium]|nr:hypothetical protein [Candidatus Eremiobacteraeota bacterium]